MTDARVSAEQENMEVAFVAINAAFKSLGWNMTPVHMLAAALERAERERDLYVGYTNEYEPRMRTAEARAEKAERALAEIAQLGQPMSGLETAWTCAQIARAALCTSEADR